MAKPLFAKKSPDQVEVPVGAQKIVEEKPAGRKERAGAKRRCQPGEKQLNVHIPEGLHRRLRLEGIRKGRPLGETLAKLLSDRLPPE